MAEGRSDHSPQLPLLNNGNIARSNLAHINREIPKIKTDDAQQDTDKGRSGSIQQIILSSWQIPTYTSPTSTTTTVHDCLLVDMIKEWKIEGPPHTANNTGLSLSNMVCNADMRVRLLINTNKGIPVRILIKTIAIAIQRKLLNAEQLIDVEGIVLLPS